MQCCSDELWNVDNGPNCVVVVVIVVIDWNVGMMELCCCVSETAAQELRMTLALFIAG